MFKEVLVLFSIIFVVSSHICLIYPEQRGGIDSTLEWGDPRCFIPNAPCGSRPINSPKVTLNGGTTFYVKFQQNLNHYNPGWPGFLDVAWSAGTNQTSDDQFTTLAIVPDYWAHLQASKTNFSVPIQVPNVDIEHATLRVRYHPNKPTEPIFHNCADIKIVKNTNQNLPTGTLIGTTHIGEPFGTPNQYNTFTIVNPNTGEVKAVNETLRFAQKNKIHNSFDLFDKSNVAFVQSQGTNAAVHGEDALYFIGSSSSNIYENNDAPNNLYKFDITTGTINTINAIQRPSNIDQWDALVSTTSSASHPFVIIGRSNTANGYTYSAFYLSKNGQVELIGTAEADNTFLNTFWAVYSDGCGNGEPVVYVLAGDENSLTALNVKLYSFNSNGQVTTTLVDNTKYTVSNIQIDNKFCNVFTLSPGLLLDGGEERTWTLINIDPSNGTVTPASPVIEQGLYDYYYGGGVYNGVTEDNNILQILRRRTDNALVLVSINIQSNTIESETYIDLGINNHLSLFGLTYIWNN